MIGSIIDKPREPLRFEVRGYYRHIGYKGRMLRIISEIDTTYNGKCFLGEGSDGSLAPIGTDEVSAENWVEIPVNEWLAGCGPLNAGEDEACDGS